MESSHAPRARLTIAMIGWARLSMGPADGGGLNQVVTQLADELVQRGHKVLYLRSGHRYSLRRGMRLEPLETWRGVECFDVVNSPNLSAGSHNFENLGEQVASSSHSSLIAKFLKDRGVDVLHIHVFEGIAFDLVGIVKREARIPVVVTPHNYMALCPQIDLLHQERRVCDDYDGGRKCAGCLKVPDFRWEKRRRARLHSLRSVLGSGVYDSIKPIGAGLVHSVSRWLPKASARRSFEVPSTPGTDFAEHLSPGEPLAHERLLANTDRHLVVLCDAGKRRGAGIAALNLADRVLAPGAYLKRVHESMGVNPAVLRHVPLGLRHLDDLRESTRRSESFDRVPWRASDPRPLRLVYFGNCWVNKGLAILVEAVERLDAATLARIELDIHASGDDRPFRMRLRARSEVRFHGAYTPADLGPALERADAGVFPGIALENSPIVILEMLTAGRFVIASKRGAMEGFIREGVNGTLFNPGDPVALAAAITRVAHGVIPLPTRRAVQEASQSRTLKEFVDEVEGTYVEVVASNGYRAPLAAALTSPETRRK